MHKRMYRAVSAAVLGLSLCLALPAWAEQNNLAQNPKFHKAKDYYFEGKFAMARVFLQDLAQKYKEDPELYTYLADSHKKLGNKREALINYRKANELLPQSLERAKQLKAQNYMQMAHIFLEFQKADEAMAHYELAAMTHSSQSLGYYYKGLTALLLKRNKKETTSAWDKYARLLPEGTRRNRVRNAVTILEQKDFELPPEGAPLSLRQALSQAGLRMDKLYPSVDDKDQNGKKTDTKTEKQTNKQE